MREISEPWAGDIDAVYLTDTDIEATRSTHVKLYDSSGERRRLAESLRREEELNDLSATLDRATRVEIASAIDEGGVSFDREEFDVAYTIPPAMSLKDQTFPRVGLVDPDELNTSEDGIGFATPGVVKEMVRRAVEEGAYDTQTTLVQHGVERMLGRKPTASNSDRRDGRNSTTSGEASERRQTTPLLVPFKNRTRQKLTAATLDVMDHEEWRPKAAIKDEISASNEAIRTEFDVLLRCGVLEVKSHGDDVYIPHYRLRDNDVVSLLTEWDGYPPFELFEYTGAQKLTLFFVRQANPHESYSYSRVDRESDMGYGTISEYMDTLVDAGLVTEVEGKRGTEYTLDMDSELFDYLIRLNEAILRELVDR